MTNDDTVVSVTICVRPHVAKYLKSGSISHRSIELTICETSSFQAWLAQQIDKPIPQVEYRLTLSKADIPSDVAARFIDQLPIVSNLSKLTDFTKFAIVARSALRIQKMLPKIAALKPAVAELSKKDSLRNILDLSIESLYQAHELRLGFQEQQNSLCGYKKSPGRKQKEFEANQPLIDEKKFNAAFRAIVGAMLFKKRLLFGNKRLLDDYALSVLKDGLMFEPALFNEMERDFQTAENAIVTGSIPDWFPLEAKGPLGPLVFRN